jgi:cob(I)alamin adenosyltransferase
MGHRLSKITTRTGDDGTTGLGDGSRLRKDDLRIEAIGTVDELNSLLGLLVAESPPDPVRQLLLRVQHDLFDLGGELSVPGRRVMDESPLLRLEQELEAMNSNLSPLKEFILPGGSRAAAVAHVARTVCRRAERCLVRISPESGVNPDAIRYLNRLSDLLFVLARELNRQSGTPDTLWQPRTR